MSNCGLQVIQRAGWTRITGPALAVAVACGCFACRRVTESGEGRTVAVPRDPVSEFRVRLDALPHEGSLPADAVEKELEAQKLLIEHAAVRRWVCERFDSLSWYQKRVILFAIGTNRNAPVFPEFYPVIQRALQEEEMPSAALLCAVRYDFPGRKERLTGILNALLIDMRSI